MKLLLLNLLLILFSSLATSQWVELADKNGLPPVKSQYYTCMSQDENTIAIGTFTNKIFISTDEGATWTAIDYTPSTGGNVFIMGIKGSNILTSISSDYQISHDSGKNWNIYTDSLHPVSGKILFNGGTGFIGDPYFLFKTTDFGETFTPVLGDGTTNLGFNTEIITDSVIIITKSKTSEILRSSDNGVTWSSPYVSSTAKYSNFIKYNDLIFAYDLNNNKMISSADKGITWIERSALSDFTNFRQIISCGNNLFAINKNQIGVYFSKDTGRIWSPVNTGIVIEHGKSGLSMLKTDHYIFALYGGSLLRAPLVNCVIDFSNDAEEELKSDVFCLPNPASDFIEIYVGTDSKSTFTNEIKIYTIYGKDVLSVGTIQELPLRIDVSALTPGMYFVKAGNKVRKFIKL